MENPTLADASGIVPIVHRLDAFHADPKLLNELQRMARNNAKHSSDQDETAPAGVHGFYVANRAVKPHQDLKGASPGMLVRGLVVQCDDHRLHSERLAASGNTEGLELRPGDLYELDPYDMHWTSVPDGAQQPIIAFYVDGDMPDERSISEIASDMLFFLRQETPRTK